MFPCTQDQLQHHDFTKFNLIKPRLLEAVDKMLAEDIARLMAMIPVEEATSNKEAAIIRGRWLTVFCRELFGWKEELRWGERTVNRGLWRVLRVAERSLYSLGGGGRREPGNPHDGALHSPGELRSKETGKVLLDRLPRSWELLWYFVMSYFSHCDIQGKAWTSQCFFLV